MKATYFVRSIPQAIALVVALYASVAPGPLFAGPTAPPETAIAPEKNPPGDIPDDQVFITYKSPNGFSLKVPEGWSRRDAPEGVSFADKYGTIDVAVTASSTTPTVASVRAGEAAELEKTGHAVKIASVKEVKLASGPAIQIIYSSNSDSNPVTNKRVRLESERFLMAHAGKLGAVTFSAPMGADNADQWKLMSNSFRWN
ncbi:MAG TPA: hypothetical protein DEA80_13780 [Afipia sp.]|nr:hypothetical protein [Afipia sp.]OUX59176.1 MAG: hypothetical protein CBB64_21055 [Afipia sp. TMED4]HAO42386.1 hypothetical protein [Afipia sp.]HAP13142.1 hypothetical protein [Afipia sp.]HAP46934.1 hypothetical protein [Afipia sp.]